MATTISNPRFVTSDLAPDPASIYTGSLFWFNTTANTVHFRPNITSAWEEVPNTEMAGKIASVEGGMSSMQSEIDNMQLIPGPMGPIGPKGDKGDTGSTGAASTVPGPQGVAGVAGTNGANGTSFNVSDPVISTVVLNTAFQPRPGGPCFVNIMATFTALISGGVVLEVQWSSTSGGTFVKIASTNLITLITALGTAYETISVMVPTGRWLKVVATGGVPTVTKSVTDL